MTGLSQEQRIRERAYALWEGEGRSQGTDREYWLRAEAEIAGEHRQKDETTHGDPGSEKRRTMKVQKSEARPANFGTECWAMTPSGMGGVVNDALAIYFLDATLASAFAARWCIGYRVETVAGDFRVRSAAPRPPAKAALRRTP